VTAKDVTFAIFCKKRAACDGLATLTVEHAACATATHTPAGPPVLGHLCEVLNVRHLEADMSASTVHQSTQQRHSTGSGLYIALVPWVAFTLLAQHSTLKLASAAALVLAIAIMIRSIVTTGAKVLEVGAVLAFTGFTIVAFGADHAAGVWMARYSRAIAAGLLALIAFASLLFTPFTEQYARESVPREHWGSPTFKQINRRITLMWAFIFTAMIPFHIAAGVIDERRTNILFNWVAPIGLLLWGIKQSEKIADQATAA
jgi:hypothetical protein